ncbi:MmcQ/YjbR family DNA-binding protein [Nocardioides pantholopis]|uniref:MmcQ/YjbR family DNA-binding protein n=1 Tax=Nocardioides pantholopis TaxID=2483798 RepID=UPI001F152163|nr:MmcQ/YjbR family DNA-binding protein [Nocardioides pantholopis]
MTVTRLDAQTMTAYCLARPGAWADDPWGHEHPVIKVGPAGRGKIFAFLSADSVGVKCGAGRDLADEWLHRFPGEATVLPHLGRGGWNALRFGGAIADEELLEAVDESYRLVVGGLPARARPPGWDG